MDLPCQVHIPELSVTNENLFHTVDPTIIAGAPQGNSFTYAFWIRLNSRQDGQWVSLIHCGNTNATEDVRAPGLYLLPNSNELHFRCDFIDGARISKNKGIMFTKELLPLNRLVHIAMVFDYADGVSTMRLYLNGEENSGSESYGSYKYSQRGTVISRNNLPLFMGRDGSHGWAKFDINHFRMYGFGLSADQVRELYAAEAEEGGIEPSRLELRQGTPDQTVTGPLDLPNEGTVNIPIVAAHVDAGNIPIVAARVDAGNVAAGPQRLDPEAEVSATSVRQSQVRSSDSLLTWAGNAPQRGPWRGGRGLDAGGRGRRTAGGRGREADDDSADGHTTTSAGSTNTSASGW